MQAIEPFIYTELEKHCKINLIESSIVLDFKDMIHGGDKFPDELLNTLKCYYIVNYVDDTIVLTNQSKIIEKLVYQFNKKSQ